MGWMGPKRAKFSVLYYFVITNYLCMSLDFTNISFICCFADLEMCEKVKILKVLNHS